MGRSSKKEAEPEVVGLDGLGFDEASIKELNAKGFRSVEDLSLLTEDETAIGELSLSLAQGLLLKREVRKAKAEAGQHAQKEHVEQQCVPSHVEQQYAGATKTTLAQVLGELKSDGSQPAAMVPTTQPADPQIFLQGGCDPRTTKVYEIIDYIHLIPPVTEEQVLSEQGDVQFVYRNAPKKPKLQTISVEEWCLANTRIMDLLMQSASFPVQDYMSYTMKICELFKHYQRQTVLQYDREYRHLQARHAFRWGTDSPHLHTLHLRLKPPSSSTSSSVPLLYSRSQGSRHRAAQVCYQYNSRAGCSYGESCKFSHVCSEPGCSVQHSRADHHHQSATTATSQTR